MLSQASNSPPEHVVLIHGIAVPRAVMIPMARRMESRDFVVHNFGYWSLYGSIKRHGILFRRQLRKLRRENPLAKINVVAHSMGCIVTRYAVRRHPSLVDRIAFLTAPHHGSKMANLAAPFVQWAFPMIGELTYRPGSWVRQLPVPAVPFVNVAASWDWLISAPSSHLTQERDHLTVRTNHSGVLLRRDVVDFLESFFRISQHEKACESGLHSVAEPA